MTHIRSRAVSTSILYIWVFVACCRVTFTFNFSVDITPQKFLGLKMALCWNLRPYIVL